MGICQMDSEEMCDNNADVSLALLQIRWMLERPGILSPATLWFNKTEDWCWDYVEHLINFDCGKTTDAYIAMQKNY